MTRMLQSSFGEAQLPFRMVAALFSGFDNFLRAPGNTLATSATLLSLQLLPRPPRCASMTGCFKEIDR